MFLIELGVQASLRFLMYPFPPWQYSHSLEETQPQLRIQGKVTAPRKGHEEVAHTCNPSGPGG